MSQVFISYTHASPDQELAATLSGFLETNGFVVFVDSKIRLGQDWVEQIDVQLRRSKYFVVFLSTASVRSDMVRREIAIAYKLRKANELTIFPIRVGFEGELPYEIGAYLDLIQHITWQPGQPFDPICRMVLDALGNSGAEPALSRVPSQAPAMDPNRFTKPELDRVKGELARHLGPVASVVLDRAARKARNWEQLYEMLALEIPAGAERKQFLATRPR